MTKRRERWRVCANVPHHVRSLLLRMFPPTFRRIYAHSITWAYDTPAEFSFVEDPQDCVLHGYHRHDGTEALLARIGGATHQPLTGRVLHLTLSIAGDRVPADAGAIDLDRVSFPAESVTFTTRLMRHKLFEQQPQQQVA